MSKTLFKVFVGSFLRNIYHVELFEDCQNAVSNQINSLSSKLEAQLQQVKLLLEDDNKNHQHMSVILEEETQRSHSGEQSNIEIRLRKISMAFNSKIATLKKDEEILDQILFVYKSQLQSLAKSLSKYEEKNQKLKRQILSLKDEKKSKKYIQNSKNQIDEQEPTKKAPQPVDSKHMICKVCMNGAENKQNQKNEANQKKNDWKMLSTKIQNLKKKIDVSQDQLALKDEKISKLTEQLRKFQEEKNSKDDDDKKKLKSTNTTLRGEKVMMMNQISALKKQINQKNQICQFQEVQLNRLKLQIENLSGTLRWHLTTINDLKASYGKAINADVKQSLQKTAELEKTISILRKSLDDQEKVSIDINDKTKKIEANYSKEIIKFQKKIQELESILDEKNELIIKLKSSSRSLEGSSYQADMIKVLTKKIAEKDQSLKELRKQLLSPKHQE